MRTPRVLLVDDDEDYARFVTRLFERAGHASPITVVHDEAAALEALGKDSFDVVLSDYELHPGNGLRVLEEARAKNEKALRILITSAPDNARIGLEAVEGVAHAVWDKHWPRDRIQTELKRLVTARAA